MADSPPAGWYEDPADATNQRWWDGAAWTSQVRPNAAAQPEAPYNYLPHAILTTIFCCTPFGVVAIVKAASVNSLWNGGQRDEAREASRAARRWGWISFGSAIAVWAVLIGIGLLSGDFEEFDEATCREDTAALITAENAHFAKTGRYASEPTLVSQDYLTGASGLHDIRLQFEPEAYRIVVDDVACGDIGDVVHSSG